MPRGDVAASLFLPEAAGNGQRPLETHSTPIGLDERFVDTPPDHLRHRHALLSSDGFEPAILLGREPDLRADHRKNVIA